MGQRAGALEDAEAGSSPLNAAAQYMAGPVITEPSRSVPPETGPAVGAELLRSLRCPVCKGALARDGEALLCGPCGKRYPIVLGIPDLRVYEDPLISLADDYRKGERVQARAATLEFPELVRFYWSLPTYPPTPPDLIERFVHHVLTDEQRTEGYREKIGVGQRFLEVGCGTAALTKVAHGRFRLAVGCDVAFRWLLIARRRLVEAGLPANLVCCCADFLPFPDGYFDTVASVSLLEHVSDAGAVLQEFGRVTRAEGRVFTWTTNRFSLACEPHVGVWGVGFLPRRWMPAYVRWRRGVAYDKKHLLSLFELRRLLRRAQLRTVQFSVPAVTGPDWDRLAGLERYGARVLKAAGNLPMLKSLLAVVAPALQVVARRSAQGGGRPVPARTAGPAA